MKNSGEEEIQSLITRAKAAFSKAEAIGQQTQTKKEQKEMLKDIKETEELLSFVAEHWNSLGPKDKMEFHWIIAELEAMVEIDSGPQMFFS